MANNIILYNIFAVRTKINDTTALGVAIAAGRSIGIDVGWRNERSFLKNDTDPNYDIFHSLTSANDRDKRYRKWKMAVDRSSHSYESQN